MIAQCENFVEISSSATVPLPRVLAAEGDDGSHGHTSSRSLKIDRYLFSEGYPVCYSTVSMPELTDSQASNRPGRGDK